MPFFLSVCESSHSSTLGQHKPHSPGAEKSGRRGTIFPQTLQHPWLTSRSPEGKATKQVQHKTLGPAGLGCVTFCASQATKQGPGRDRASSPPGQGLCTGKDERKTARSISDYQQPPGQAATKSRVRLRKEHILLVLFLMG